MVKLTKPFDGVHFWIWRFLVHLNFAKSGTWGYNTNSGSVRTDLLAITVVSFEDAKALSFVFGPFKLMIRYA